MQNNSQSGVSYTFLDVEAAHEIEQNAKGFT